MKAIIFCANLMLGAATLPAIAQNVQKLDPQADRIITGDSHVERVATGFDKWTEGPVWTRTGDLLFAEIPANTIRKWVPGQSSSVFIHPSGYQGTAPYKGPEPGSNGMTLDADGRLTVAGHARRNVWRLESMSASASITVLADSYDGKPLNSPNDLVYKSDGSLYFTDPPYGLPTQSDNDPAKKLTVNGVYRIVGARQQTRGAKPDGTKIQLLIKDLPRPNGIAFSPDERVLYVSDSGKRLWMRYDVAQDGSVSNGSVFLDTENAKGLGGPDGIKVDREGNLYGSAPGGVWVISPKGKHILTIPIPESAANLAWGDADAKSLYITASTSLYRIRLNIPGILPGHPGHP